MNPSATLNCLHCGAPLDIPRDSIKVQCRYCKRVYDNLNKDITADLRDISRFRQLRDFIKAEDLCTEYKRKNPACGELYWQSLLIEYGIVYVTDATKQVPVPTFFHHSYEKGHELASSDNFKLAIENAATSGDADFYRTQVEELDGILRRHFELLDKEPAYNIFISFKSSDVIQTIDGSEMTIETQDCKTAREIYELFTKKKYNVFFSPESIGKDKNLKGKDYEPRILKALQTSQAMVLLASKYEYLESAWVENEWKRYMYFIGRGKKMPNSLIIVYFGKPPKLPAALGGRIEHTMIDALSLNFKDELIRALEFVKPGGKRGAKIPTRVLNEGFDEESLDYTGAGEKRVNIGQSRTITHITASEAREMQNANLYLVNKNYNIAYQSFKKIADENPNNGKAYFGMFLSKVKVKLPDKYITGSLRGVSPTEITQPADLIYSFKSVGPEAFSLLEAAINNPTDEDFTDNLINMLMYQVAKAENDNQIVKLLEVLAKYIPDKSIKNLLDIIKGHTVDAVKAGNLKFATALYETCRDKLFIAENNAFNMAFLRDFANSLYFSGYHKEAIEYFNTYLKASHEAAMYWNLLGCRLGGSPMRSFKLKINKDDDASKKEPKDLDKDEIIERILICSKCDFENVTVKDLMRLLSYQIQNNFSHHRPFIECVGNGVLSIKGEAAYLEFLYKIAMVMIFERRFSEAKTYLTDMDSVITESDTLTEQLGPTKRSEMLALIRWGLLKCRLHAVDDYEICRSKKKLEEYTEYREALNSATDAQHKYFSSVYSAHQNRREDYMKKFACLPELRKHSNAAKEIMPQFGVIESFYSPVTVKTKALSRQKTKKAAARIFAAVLIAAILLLGAYVGFVKENTVTFETEGWGNIDPVTSKAFKKIEDPGNLIRPGYTFEGWYDGFGNKWDFENSFVVWDTTLTPKWSYGTVGIEYELYGDGVAIIGYTGTDSIVNIPEKLDGYNVLRIENEAFFGNDTIKKVILPEGIASVGMKAFSQCGNLTHVYIPASVVSAGSNIFYGSSPAVYMSYSVNTGMWDSYWNAGLSRDNVKRIDGVSDDGFGYVIKSLQIQSGETAETKDVASIEAYFGSAYDLTVPDKIAGYDTAYVGSGAFSGESRLVRITLPETLTLINSGAFLGCDKLISVICRAKEVSVSSNAFNSDHTLFDVYSESNAFDGAVNKILNKLESIDAKGVVTIDNGLVFVSYSDENNTEEGLFAYVGYAKELTLPSSFGENSTYKLYNGAFSGNEIIEKITLSAAVSEVGEGAFANCSSLESVFIPASLTKVSKDLFRGSPNVKVYMESAEAPADFDADWNAAQRPVFYGVTSEYGITPSGLEWIKKADGTVVLIGLKGKPDDEPKDSASIANNTYELFIPKTIKGAVVNEIVPDIFKNRYLIKTLSIPGSVKELYPGMLSGCVSLETVKFPSAGVMGLSDEVPESGDAELEVLYAYPIGYFFGEERYSVVDTTYYGNDTVLASVGVTQHYYEKGNSWSERTYQLPKNLKVIAIDNGGYVVSYAFENMIDLTDVLLGNGVKAISEHAFIGCSGLTSIYVPTDLASIGDRAFSGCSALKNIYQGDEEINPNILPTSLEFIGEEAFLGCSSLESLDVRGAKTLSRGFLTSCFSLSSLTIPFVGCTASETTDYAKEEVLGYFFGQSPAGGNVYVIESSDATYYIPGTLKSVTVTGEKVISDKAFYGFSSLESVDLPDNLTEIGELAFSNCTSLSMATLPDGVTSIGQEAFAYCKAFVEFMLPKSVKSIGLHAFASCTAINKFIIPRDSMLESIGAGAFAACIGIKSLDIPASVTTVSSSIIENAGDVVIYCAAEEKPEGWDEGWIGDKPTVIFGYDGSYITYRFVTEGGAVADIIDQRAIKLPTPPSHPTKSYFIGWYDNAEFAGRAVDSEHYYSKTATTLYARWESEAPGSSLSVPKEIPLGEPYKVTCAPGSDATAYFEFFCEEAGDYTIYYLPAASNTALTVINMTLTVYGDNGEVIHTESAERSAGADPSQYVITLAEGQRLVFSFKSEWVSGFFASLADAEIYIKKYKWLDI